MLGTIGIEPKNGWIAGYPVSPVVIGEIKKGVAAAADAGKLEMGKDQALKAVENLEANFGLNVIPGAAPAFATQTIPGGEAAIVILQVLSPTIPRGQCHVLEVRGIIHNR
jgi:hypothetical protein